MNAIEKAVYLAGGPAKCATALDVTPQAVCFWRDGKRAFPERLAARLEDAVSGQVRRWDLFPDSWHLIWPELVAAAGAPAVSRAQAAPVPLALSAEHAAVVPEAA